MDWSALLALPVLVTAIGAGKWIGSISEAVKRIDIRLDRIESKLGIVKKDEA